MYYNYNRSIPKPFQEGLPIPSEPVTAPPSTEVLSKEALPKEALPKETLPKKEICVAENFNSTRNSNGSARTALLVLLLTDLISS